MLKAALVDVWPLAAALIFVCGGLAAIVQGLKSKVQSRRRSSWTLDFGPWTLDFGRTLDFHADQRGSVESLSFVLTVPVFIMLMLLAVQITQLMIGLVVVHYAAFAAARSATVWIPARLGQNVQQDGENRVGLQRVFQQGGAGGELTQNKPAGEINAK